MSQPQPSVGRDVHYVSYGTPGGEFPSVCRAAKITEVIDSGHVGLCVFSPEGLFFNRGVAYGEDSRGGTWHWPERVGA